MRHLNTWLPLLRRHWIAAGIGSVVAVYLLGPVLHQLARFAWGLALAVAIVIVAWAFLGSRDPVAASQAGPVASGGGAAASPATWRKRRVKPIETGSFAARLGEGAPIGLSPPAAQEIAQDLYAFQVNTAPRAPWSLLLVADEEWVLQAFAERFCAGLGLALPRVPVFECTTLAEFNLDELSKAVRGVPVLVVRGVERLRQHGSANRVTAPLEVVLQGRQPGWNAVTILLLETSKGAGRQPTGEATDPLSQRQALREALRSASALPVERVRLLSVLQPLTEKERIQVLWEEFCRLAKGEYGVGIANAAALDQTPAEDRLIEFLEHGLTAWNAHGVAAAQDAIRRAAQDALAAARVAGIDQAAPYWLPASGELQLQPARVRA